MMEERRLEEEGRGASTRKYGRGWVRDLGLLQFQAVKRRQMSERTFRKFGQRRLRLTTSSRVATSGLRPKGLSGPPVLGDLRRGDPSLFFFFPPPSGRLAERGGGC